MINFLVRIQVVEQVLSNCRIYPHHIPIMIFSLRKPVSFQSFPNHMTLIAFQHFKTQPQLALNLTRKRNHLIHISLLHLCNRLKLDPTIQLLMIIPVQLSQFFRILQTRNYIIPSHRHRLRLNLLVVRNFENLE